VVATAVDVVGHVTGVGDVTAPTEVRDQKRRSDPVPCPTPHNRTQKRGGTSGCGPHVTLWDAGTLLRVSRPGVSQPPTGRRCVAWVSDSDGTSHQCRCWAVGGSEYCATHLGVTRSEVSEFSYDSRARLRRRLGRLRRDVDCLFVTLTWPTWAAPDSEAWHRSWDRLRVSMAREFPNAGGFWKREYTKAGVVHLHLLVYGVTWRGMVTWLPYAWTHSVGIPVEVLRERSNVDRVRVGVEVPYYAHATQAYIGKYIAKRAGGSPGMGRWWGVFGDVGDNIPWADSATVDVSDRTAVRVIRTVRKYIDAQRRKRGGRKVRHPWSRAGASLICDVPKWRELVAYYERLRLSEVSEFYQGAPAPA